jgi:hypothetical protein
MNSQLLNEGQMIRRDDVGFRSAHSPSAGEAPSAPARGRNQAYKHIRRVQSFEPDADRRSARVVVPPPLLQRKRTKFNYQSVFSSLPAKQHSILLSATTLFMWLCALEYGEPIPPSSDIASFLPFFVL